MVFFTDRDLGAYIFPEALREAGISVERHVDHFPPGETDEVWLRAVAQRQWHVLTNDKGILKRPVERDTVIGHGIGLFILVGANMTGQESARNFVNTFDQICRFIQNNERPFIAKVYRPSPVKAVWEGRSGSVVLKYPI